MFRPQGSGLLKIEAGRARSLRITGERITVEFLLMIQDRPGDGRLWSGFGKDFGGSV